MCSPRYRRVRACGLGACVCSCACGIRDVLVSWTSRRALSLRPIFMYLLPEAAHFDEDVIRNSNEFIFRRDTAIPGRYEIEGVARVPGGKRTSAVIILGRVVGI